MNLSSIRLSRTSGTAFRSTMAPTLGAIWRLTGVMGIVWVATGILAPFPRLGTVLRAFWCLVLLARGVAVPATYIVDGTRGRDVLPYDIFNNSLLFVLILFSLVFVASTSHIVREIFAAVQSHVDARPHEPRILALVKQGRRVGMRAGIIFLVLTATLAVVFGLHVQPQFEAYGPPCAPIGPKLDD